ncbi:MAG TPA: hypothetical protein VFQ91_17835 [Bryobacteraceae bacterium]|nr:hypothetical protein [Bryobacteraceae bacterium]
MARQIIASALLLTCLSPILSAQESIFDVATFRPPPAWERIPGPGPLLFRSPDATSQLFLFRSRAAPAAAPEDNFRAEWAKLVAASPLGNLPLPANPVSSRRGDWTAVIGAANAPPRRTVILFTATNAGRVASILASIVGQHNLAAVNSFFDSLHLNANSPPAAAAPPPPAAGQASLAGLFYYVQAGLGSGTRLEVRTRFFLPGNRIARVFPYGSGDAFEPARCSPDTCGAYALTPDRLTIRWDNGQIDNVALAAGAGGLTLAGTLYRPARPLTTPALANGVWAGAGQSGGALTNIYRFSPDGTFTFGAGGPAGQGGRYHIDGRSLILRFQDGVQRRLALFATSPSDPPGTICIEGEIFLHRQAP